MNVISRAQDTIDTLAAGFRLSASAILDASEFWRRTGFYGIVEECGSRESRHEFGLRMERARALRTQCPAAYWAASAALKANAGKYWCVGNPGSSKEVDAQVSTSTSCNN